MRRRAYILIFLAVVASGLMTGCTKPEMQRCVDQDRIVVDDDLCHATGEQRILGQRPKASGAYRYYYGGTGSTETGTLAEGGSYIRLANHNYAVAREYKPRNAVIPVAVVIGALAIFFFGWEGKMKRPMRRDR
jgi:hypothetical protein